MSNDVESIASDNISESEKIESKGKFGEGEIEGNVEGGDAGVLPDEKLVLDQVEHLKELNEEGKREPVIIGEDVEKGEIDDKEIVNGHGNYTNSGEESDASDSNEHFYESIDDPTDASFNTQASHPSKNSSRESSPFILNPDVGADVPEIRLQDYAHLSSPERYGDLLNDSISGALSDEDNDLEEELETVNETNLHHEASGPNNLVISPLLKQNSSSFGSSPRSYNTSNISNQRLENGIHNNSSFVQYDETGFQLDADLDLDVEKPRSTGAISRSKSTPWRRLRSSKIYSNLPNVPYTDQADLTSDTVAINNNHNNNDETKSNNNFYASSNTAKVEELNKQIVGYRIQIKFLRDYLQDLIRKSEIVGARDGNNLEDMLKFQRNHLPLGDLLSIHAEQAHYEKLLLEIESLTLKLKEQDNEYNEICKLNEDLYGNLEVFQNDLINKENLLNQSREQIAEWCKLLDIILIELVKGSGQNSINEIQEHLENNANEVQNAKLLTKKIELAHIHLITSVTEQQARNAEEMEDYVKTIEQLVQSVQSLKSQVTYHTQNTSNVESQLNNEIESSQRLKQKYHQINRKLNQITELHNNNEVTDRSVLNSSFVSPSRYQNSPHSQTPISPTKQYEYEQMKSENLRLQSVKEGVDAKLEEYQNIIDHLQQEVNGLKGVDDNPDISNTELNTNQKEIHSLQEELHALTEAYRNLQKDSTKTINSLTSQLNNKKNESIALKASGNATERLRQDLDLAIEKQRILQAEKIRLTYNVESLSNDKAALQANISSLTDQITQYATGINSKLESESNDAAKLKMLEYQFEEFILFDIVKFQKLLNSFIKIADDVSLKDPKKKIEWLTKNIIRNSEENDRKWDAIGGLKKPYQYHQSVFDYFVRAVDIIVHDHVKLLLKEGEESRKKGAYILKLQQRIDELNAVNDALTDVSEVTNNQQQKQQQQHRRLSHTKLILQMGSARVIKQNEEDNSADQTEDTFGSPRTNLRLEELTNRWKAEREARVYENKASQRRLRELEVENAKLRVELARNS